MGARVDREALREVARNSRAKFKYKPRVSKSAFPGEFSSPYTGSGSEFAGFKEYEPGDDLRKIHPQETSRQGGAVPVLSEYAEQRDVRLLVVADVSRSAFLREKPLVLYSAFCMLSFWAEKEYIPMGLWLAGSGMEMRFKPSQNRKQMRRMDAGLVSVLCDGFTSGKNVIESGVEGLNGLNPGWFRKFLPIGSVVVVLSDFLSEGGARSIETFAAAFRGLKVVPVIVQDDMEYTFPEFPAGSSVLFEDCETGRMEEVLFSRKTLLQTKDGNEQRFSDITSGFSENNLSFAHIKELDFKHIYSELAGKLRTVARS